jgi:hypothetical protein
MLASYIILKDGEKPIFGTCIPTIFDIQNLIEQAWDKGYSPRGRIETGGIRGTRKYIGTPEVGRTSLSKRTLKNGLAHLEKPALSR